MSDAVGSKVVRSVAARALRALGYDVVTAPDGRQAVDIYREQQGAIDLVIIDMVMPEMGGRECFRALRELDPHVKAVLSTGYGRDGKAQGALDDGMLGFVQKPYRMQELSAAVAAALRR